MRLKADVPYISEQDLEARANKLIEDYSRYLEPILEPPIPVEKIADFLLELGISWKPIADKDDAPILAYIHPQLQTIFLNENRQSYFEQYTGTYEFTLAHEIGHYLLHFNHFAELATNSTPQILHRSRSSLPANADRREWQAERFASYLLLPTWLLQPALENINLFRWKNLYRLRDLFNVSITALKIRLENLGALYVASNGKIYQNKNEAAVDLRREGIEQLNRGRMYIALAQPEQAIACYERSLAIACELNHQKDIAYRAWQVALLVEDSDPAYALDLMAVCVKYEQLRGHSSANSFVQQAAELQARISQ